MQLGAYEPQRMYHNIQCMFSSSCSLNLYTLHLHVSHILVITLISSLSISVHQTIIIFPTLYSSLSGFTHFYGQWFILNVWVCTSPSFLFFSLTAVTSAVCVCTPQRRYWSLPVMTTPGRCGHCQGTDTLTTGLVPDSSP